MNNNETKMLLLLKILREECGGSYVRAEFEAEGLALQDLLRLKEVAVRAGYPIALKIGGCEGLRDLGETKIIGTDKIIAPMIESGFALRKFFQALGKTYTSGNEEAEFWFNFETKTAYKNLDKILAEPAFDSMAGVVIERVDLCFSLDMGADDVDSPKISPIVKTIAQSVKSKGKKVTIGGGVSSRSVASLIELRDAGLLDYAETRKVGFNLLDQGVDSEKLRKGVLIAVAFEILFLENRTSFFNAIDVRDNERILYLRNTYANAIRDIVPNFY